jgi:predicted ATPase/transcriptional regulator with XRE-family HTH domain
MATIEMSFGKWLRGERRRMDLSRQALAARVGCAEITLRRIESGTLKPSRELAFILLEQLEIPEPDRGRWVLFARGLSGHPMQTDEAFPAKMRSVLPVFLTTFIGRSKEKSEIIHLINTYRLVTLTGSGGVGKTRLAGKVGEQVLADFSDGVWMVELASQADPAQVLQAVAAVFGLTTQSNTSYLELLVNFLRPRKILVILDNCEHLPQACAQLAEDLLKNCPDLKILATSREPLKVMGEAVYRVPSMGIPEAGGTLDEYREFETIQLFEERARLAQPDYSLTINNVESVVRVCRRLDGIPLAIELAAARVTTFSIEQIATKLDENFDLLSNGSRIALPRQQTIHGSIDWSWNLLIEAEQIVLRRLSVFAGGWALQAAEAVCGGNGIEHHQVADLIAQLAAKSLVRVHVVKEKENRYHLHEMILQFAHEKMEAEEEENTRSRHLKYFLSFSEQAETALHGPQQLVWLNQVNEERANLRSALRWASRTDTEAGLLIIGRLMVDLDLCEGMEWAAEFIGKPDSHSFPLARAKALLTQAEFMWRLQQFEASRSALRESIDLFRACGNREGEFGCLMLMGSIVQLTEGMERKVEYQGEALTLARSIDDTWRQAWALSGLGWDQRDPQQAKRYWEEAVMLYRQVGDWRSLAFLLAIFGDTLLANGMTMPAQSMLDESLDLIRHLNYKPGMEFILVARSRQALLLHDYAKARLSLQEWINLAEEMGNRMGYLWGRARLGFVALVEGNHNEGYQILCETALKFQKDKNQAGLAFTLEKLAHYYIQINMPDRSARLVGWADSTRERTGDIRPATEQADLAGISAACISKLGKAGYEEAYQQGALMSLDEAVVQALHEVR